MEGLISITVFVVVSLLVGRGVDWAYVADDKGTHALHWHADALRLQFVKETGDSVRYRFERFALFSRGRKRKVKNLIEGDSGEGKI